jgi:hypothetical protein
MNSICNALFLSDLGSKLMRSLYVDWVIGIRTPNDHRRNRVLAFLRFMVDYAGARVGRELFDVEQPVDMASLIKKLTRYSSVKFPNVGRNNGWFPDHYIKNFIVFAGVPLERVLFVQLLKTDRDFPAERIERLVSRRKTRPIVVLVNCRIIVSKLQKGKLTSLTEIPSFDVPDTLFDEEYKLDACTASSYSPHGGHAAAGMTCGGKRYLVDSNDGEQSARIKIHDWASATAPAVKTVTKGFKWSSKTPRTFVYYNSELVNCLYKRSKVIATDWLRTYAVPGTRDADGITDGHPTQVPTDVLNRWKWSLRSCQ